MPVPKTHKDADCSSYSLKLSSIRAEKAWLDLAEIDGG